AVAGPVVGAVKERDAGRERLARAQLRRVLCGLHLVDRLAGLESGVHADAVQGEGHDARSNCHRRGLSISSPPGAASEDVGPPRATRPAAELVYIMPAARAGPSTPKMGGRRRHHAIILAARWWF